MKQTAVEWLINELKCIKSECGNQTVKIEIKEKLLKQAKEMEKEQIKDAFVDGADKGEMFNNENRAFTTDADDYYNETFKSE